MNWKDVAITNMVGSRTDHVTQFIAETFFGMGNRFSGAPPLIFTSSGESLTYYKITGTMNQTSDDIKGVGDYDSNTGLYKITVTVSGITTDIYLKSPLYEGEYLEYPDKVVRMWNVITFDGTEISNASDFFADKYGNGKPVKVWFPLAEPITENINLPTISTINGENVLTVETAVQPPYVNVKC